MIIEMVSSDAEFTKKESEDIILGQAGRTGLHGEHAGLSQGDLLDGCSDGAPQLVGLGVREGHALAEALPPGHLGAGGVVGAVQEVGCGLLRLHLALQGGDEGLQIRLLCVTSRALCVIVVDFALTRHNGVTFRGPALLRG